MNRAVFLTLYTQDLTLYTQDHSLDYVLIFRGVVYEHLIHTMHVSNFAHFELTEINKIFKYIWGFDELKCLVGTLKEEGVPRKRTKAYRGEGSKN